MKLQFTLPHKNIVKIGTFNGKKIICFENDIFDSKYIDIDLPDDNYTANQTKFDGLVFTISYFCCAKIKICKNGIHDRR